MSPLLGWLACAGAVAGWLATVAGQRARAERLARLAHDVRGPLTALGLALHGAAPGSRNGPAAREAALRAADGQLGRARDVLDASLASDPNNEEALIARAHLET